MSSLDGQLDNIVNSQGAFHDKLVETSTHLESACSNGLGFVMPGKACLDSSSRDGQLCDKLIHARPAS